MIKRLFRGPKGEESPSDAASPALSERESFSSDMDLDMELDTPGEDFAAEMSDDTIIFDSADSAERLQMQVDSAEANKKVRQATTFVDAVPVFSLDLQASSLNSGRKRQNKIRNLQRKTRSASPSRAIRQHRPRPAPLTVDSPNHRKRAPNYVPPKHITRPALPSPGPGMYDIKSAFQPARLSPKSCTWGTTPRMMWTPEQCEVGAMDAVLSPTTRFS
jgi:hypothetical protein